MRIAHHTWKQKLFCFSLSFSFSHYLFSVSTFEMAKHHDKSPDTSTYNASTGGSVPTTTGGAVIISLVVLLAVCLCICLQFRQLRSCLGRHAPWFLPSILHPVPQNKDELVETGLYEKYSGPSFDRNANANCNYLSDSSIRSLSPTSLVVVKPLPPLPTLPKSWRSISNAALPFYSPKCAFPFFPLLFPLLRQINDTGPFSSWLYFLVSKVKLGRYFTIPNTWDKAHHNKRTKRSCNWPPWVHWHDLKAPNGYVWWWSKSGLLGLLRLSSSKDIPIYICLCEQWCLDWWCRWFDFVDVSIGLGCGYEGNDWQASIFRFNLGGVVNI